MYVNLELDRASCLHRFRDVYEAMGIRPTSLHNIDIWNLRGKAVPMDQLVPKLVRRAQKKNLAAVIIDPIYKVITGDENSAEQMAKFCNQFDKICAELGCATIYCHHHSKGAQGDKKSMDRASGSGVFARDPDAQLDLIELPVSEELREQRVNRAVCDWIVGKAGTSWLERADEGWEEKLGQDDLLVARTLINFVENGLAADKMGEWLLNGFRRQLAELKTREAAKTAWQIDATLREFPSFEPINVWFEYPVHRIDDVGVLKDVQPESAKTFYEKARERNKESHAKSVDRFEIAFTNLEMSGNPVSLQELSEAINTDPKTVGAWLGTGRKKKKYLADRFETYYRKDDPEDKKKYVRRYAKDGATPEGATGATPEGETGVAPSGSRGTTP